jgi:hypothetical protein
VDYISMRRVLTDRAARNIAGNLCDALRIGP